MALFEYFPNYVWNLSVAMALESGARIGEIIDMCQPLREVAKAGADAGTPMFMAQWVRVADTLVELLQQNTQLTEVIQSLTKRIEQLTQEMHAKVVQQTN